MLFLFGIVGYLMRRFDFPVAPAIIGMILGPLAEENFRRALSITQGDYSVFFTHPISAVLLAIAALIIVAPFLLRLRQRRLLASS
jgi:putative tricarboxylic transport membrane protein